MRIEENFSLINYNTFGLDVSAAWFVEYATEEELIKILNDEFFLEQSRLHIGKGSNLLFLDNYEGIILHSAISGIEVKEETETDVTLRVGAGVDWDYLVEYAVKHNWWGIENLSLIPGETGSAALQNIGAYGSEVKDVIVEVEVLSTQDKKKYIFSNAACDYAYRSSKFKKKEQGNYIITYVTIKLSKIANPQLGYGALERTMQTYDCITLANIRDAVISIRNSKLPDPKVQGNAGSFFMNPTVDKAKFLKLHAQYPEMPYYEVSDDCYKIPAAWLIDTCQLKGVRIGNAAVHIDQPLVLINLGGATGTEIALLAEAVRSTVNEKFEIMLEPEVNYIG